ncbi:MAG: transglycosylase SLT domain-containing protein [Pseudomonadota bacterium]
MNRPLFPFRAVLLCLPLVALSLPCDADIYGYVDEHGVAHLSDTQLDSRYYLFKKEPPEPPPETGMNGDPPSAELLNLLVNPTFSRQYSPMVSAMAREHKLDAALLHAVITVESGYNPKARSPKGAIGLMQLMPDTAKRYDVGNIWDPSENVRGGARYLRYLLQLFNDNLSLTLAAYNAGEAAVIQYGNKIPPYAETRSYVPKVLLHYDRFRKIGRQ